jgi:hemoglobin
MGDESTLYERIGGADVLSRVIDDFYGRVTRDPDLSPFFRKTSMDKLRRMQHEFLGAALDGPQQYTGLSLAHVHSGLGITVHHFNRFTQHLLETLRDMGVDEKDIEQVISRINLHVHDIVGGTIATD